MPMSYQIVQADTQENIKALANLQCCQVGEKTFWEIKKINHESVRKIFNVFPGDLTGMHWPFERRIHMWLVVFPHKASNVEIQWQVIIMS